MSIDGWPGARIVKKTGFVEQPLAPTDLRPGRVVSVEAKYEGNEEGAEVVKVVLVLER